MLVKIGKLKHKYPFVGDPIVGLQEGWFYKYRQIENKVDAEKV